MVKQVENHKTLHNCVTYINGNRKKLVKIRIISIDPLTKMTTETGIPVDKSHYHISRNILDNLLILCLLNSFHKILSHLK